MNKKTPKEKVYIVLGMRSASSLVARALHAQGIDMGSGFIRGSKTGQETCEDKDTVSLNNAILKLAGGSWDNPPSDYSLERAGSRYDTKQKIKKLCNVDKDMWGWKDPRTILTLPFYLRSLKDKDIYLICSLRKPRYVANSFKRVHGFSEKKAMRLAKTYSKNMLRHIKSFLELE